MRKRSEPEKAPTTLQTVERALSFLEMVADAPRPPRLKDVAAAMGINVTTGYHLLNTLMHRGYVTRDGDGTLRIGSRVAGLHQGLLRRFAVGRDLHDIVEQLSLATGETAYLSGYSGDGVVIQSVIEATHAVAVRGLRVGYSGSEHVRASGKAVLAFLPDDKRAALLRRSLGKRTARAFADTAAELEAEFEQVRQQGFALDEEEFDDGVCCAAAPYFASDGSVLGSISLSAPSARFYRLMDELTKAVSEAGREISASLGHQGTTGT